MGWMRWIGFWDNMGMGMALDGIGKGTGQGQAVRVRAVARVIDRPGWLRSVLVVLGGLGGSL